MGRPSFILSMFQNKCPRCREGKLFQGSSTWNLKKNLKMPKYCDLCGQPTEIEVGFYYGTGYVSYVLTVGLSLITFLLWFLFIGMSTEDNRFFYWLIANAVLLIFLQPYLMRVSRTIWLTFFVRYDANWKDHPLKRDSLERIIPDQMEVVEDKH